MRLVELDWDILHVGLVWSGAGGLRRAGHSGAQPTRALGDRRDISGAGRGLEHSRNSPGRQVDTRPVAPSDAAGGSVHLSWIQPRPLQSFSSLDASRPTMARDVRSRARSRVRSEEHTSELQSPCNLVCRLLLEKKKKIN